LDGCFSIPKLEIGDLQVNRCSVASFARHEESIQSKVFRATATSRWVERACAIHHHSPSAEFTECKTSKHGKFRLCYCIKLAFVSRFLPLNLSEDGWMLAKRLRLDLMIQSWDFFCFKTISLIQLDQVFFISNNH
jgi:hypothetical protein